MRLFNIYISFFCVVIYTASATESDKRAPLGFTGVRGKKSEELYSDNVVMEGSPSSVVSSEDVIGVEKRAPSGFMGMRGKKQYEEWVPSEYQDILYKRAPSGFFGMRGKKDMIDFDEYEKRAPSGFLGMRGKKESTDFDSYMDKRVPSGFFGMRGKKDYESIIDEIKRAPNSGFFGMRGKKQPGRSGFFGMRGKKYPYEFRGKFVGVRGKKMANQIESPDFENLNLEEDLTRYENGLDLNQLMLLLTENDSYNNLQKGGLYAEK